MAWRETRVSDYEEISGWFYSGPSVKVVLGVFGGFGELRAVLLFR